MRFFVKEVDWRMKNEEWSKNTREDKYTFYFKLYDNGSIKKNTWISQRIMTDL